MSTNPFAGKTLAEIAATMDLATEAQRPRLVKLATAVLEERINRPNAKPGSVKRAQAALARLTSGASVAIPARPEKPAKPASHKPAPRRTSPARTTRTIPGDEITLNEAIALTRKYNLPVARHWSALAKAGVAGLAAKAK